MNTGLSCWGCAMLGLCGASAGLWPGKLSSLGTVWLLLWPLAVAPVPGHGELFGAGLLMLARAEAKAQSSSAAVNECQGWCIQACVLACTWLAILRLSLFCVPLECSSVMLRFHQVSIVVTSVCVLRLHAPAVPPGMAGVPAALGSGPSSLLTACSAHLRCMLPGQGLLQCCVQAPGE